MSEIKTDLDLAPAFRTEANYWRAAAFKYRLELAAQTRGMMRLAKQNKKFREEIKRLNDLLSPKLEI
jgi:hypothetical protein